MTKRVSQNFRLKKGEKIALQKLAQSGYSFPANTEAGAFRKMLKDAWEKEFPGKPFPPDDGGHNDAAN